MRVTADVFARGHWGRRFEWFAITLPTAGTPEREAWPKAPPAKTWPRSCAHRLSLGDFGGGYQCVRRNGHGGRHAATTGPDHAVVAVWRADRPVQRDHNHWWMFPSGGDVFRGRVLS